MNRYQDPTLSPSERAADLTSRLTLEEKVNQIACRIVMAAGTMDKSMKFHDGIGQLAIMGGKETPKQQAAMLRKLQESVIASSRFGIPAVIHCEALSGPVFPNALTFPTSISLAATFEPAVVKEMCEHIRAQMIAIGARQALSPVLDVARELRWGRVNETYGGDPTLISEMTCAFVEGLQGEDHTQGVAATAKHFLGYSTTEGGQNMTRTAVNDRDIRAVYVKPFEAAIRKSRLLSVMNSYSELNGRPICASKKVLQDLLRDDLGFTGVVVSDYMSVERLVNNFHVAKDMQDAAVQCLKAGLDIELPDQNGYSDKLVDAIKKGLLDEKYVDISCQRSLELKFKLGLFENPYPATDDVIDRVYDNTDNDKLSWQAARKAMTLTKNDGILPLMEKSIKVAVIGPSGNNLRRMWAGYTSVSMEEMAAIANTSAMAGLGGDLSEQAEAPFDPFSLEGGAMSMSTRIDHPEIMEPLIRRRYPQAKTIFEALQAYFSSIRFVEGCSYNNKEEIDLAAITQAAKEADLVIVTVGGKNGWGAHCTKGEGTDSASFALPGAQEQLLQAVGNANPNFIIVHTDAYPLVSPYAYDHARAILEGWLCCTYAGQAIAETLVGDNNPGGKTPLDIPYADGITPKYHYQPNATHCATMQSLNNIGYIDQPEQVSRPFGYGLSYTTFSYGNLTLKASQDAIPVMTVSVDVTNTGSLSGDDVVQLYGKDMLASVIRPYHELIGFKRITLQPGETKKVTFTFKLDQLAFIDEDGKWILEKGDYVFFAGTNSADEHLYVEYTLLSTADIDYTCRSFFAEVTAS